MLPPARYSVGLVRPIIALSVKFDEEGMNCTSVFLYFGGLEVACWPLVPKFAGSNPAEAVGFLRVNKNPQLVGGHGCLSVVIVVCCQVEVSATN